MPSIDSINDAVNTVITRSKDSVFTELQGEVVILNGKIGKYYSLNAIGSYIWKTIEQPTTLAAVVEAVFNAYNVDRQRCEADVRILLKSLALAGLVEICSVKPVDAPDLQ